MSVEIVSGAARRGVISAAAIKNRVKKLGKQAALQEWANGWRSGKFGKDQIDLHEAANGWLENGSAFIQACNPNRPGLMFAQLAESSSPAVDSSWFSNIMGPVIFNEIDNGFRQEEFTEIMDLFPTQRTQFNGEKIPGLQNIGDKAEVVKEQEQFPEVQFGENYYETPATTKRGMILSLTKEAIFFNRTGNILEQAASVGESLALTKMKNILKVVIGATNNHKWNGTSYNTYSTTTPWVNKKASLPFVDWDSINQAELLFDDMTDPYTGEPIALRPNVIMTSQYNRMKVLRVLTATEVRHKESGSAIETVGQANPYRGTYRPVVTRYLAPRLINDLSVSSTNAKDYWFMMNPAAFRYMENWPITVVQAPRNSEAEFERDVVVRYKASERGQAFARQPRLTAMLYNA